METIVAQASALSSGGVSIVRLSGDKAKEIASQIIECKKPLYIFDEPRKMQLVNVVAQGIVDKCLVVYFKAPESFTGEDIVEFHLHGGVKLALTVINTLVSLGARMAEPGEYSKRAFLNGKISLDEAEGIIDIINAESESQLKTASKLSSGEFFNYIKSKQATILDATAHLSVLIDYEYDEPDGDKVLSEIFDSIKALRAELTKTLASYKQGRLIKSGLSVAILGATNAGKSSLLNAICGSEVAIVSAVAGTTRDVVKESIIYKGIKLNFLDTAGLRETGDEIEQIGIQRSYKTASESDFILYVLDSSSDVSPRELDYVNDLNENKTIIVFSKIDKPQKLNRKLFHGFNSVDVSAKNGVGIKELLDLVVKMSAGEEPQTEFVLTSERHFALTEKCVKALTEAENLINTHDSLELIAFNLEQAFNALGEITGDVGAEKIIDKIFSDFCVGK